MNEYSLAKVQFRFYTNENNHAAKIYIILVITK